MKDPVIACLCPTYKRPENLQNSVACFEHQTYPHKHLVICDDANQHFTQVGKSWSLISTPKRHPHLPAKFNALARMADTIKPDLLVVWEDDDVYLPHHLETLAAAYRNAPGLGLYRPETVWTTYQQPKGRAVLESAQGRFHSSWGYSRDAFWDFGGYPDTEDLIFDQKMGNAIERTHGVAYYGFGNNPEWCTVPSFVYRWGNATYHGSSHGRKNYKKLWNALGQQVAPWAGRLVPHYDEETVGVMDHARQTALWQNGKPVAVG